MGIEIYKDMFIFEISIKILFLNNYLNNYEKSIFEYIFYYLL